MASTTKPDRAQLRWNGLVGRNRRMYAFGAIILSLIVSGCGFFSGTIDGSGASSTEQYEVGSFAAIDVGDDLKVQIKFDPESEPGLEITIDDNLHEHLDVRVVDDRLQVELGTGSDIRPTAGVALLVSGYDVTSLAVTSDASIDATLPAASAIDLQLNDDGKIDVVVDTETLNVNADSNAELDLSGRADNVDVTSDNDAIVRLGRTQVIDASVRADNNAIIEIDASGSIVGTADSDALIRTGGNATVDVTTSGDALVERL